MGHEADRRGPLIPTMEKVLHLKRIPLFAELGVRELTAVASIVKEESFPPLEIIIREGDLGDRLYFILRGRVSVIKSYDTPQAIHLADIGENDYFGEMALFDLQPRSATVVAREPTHVLVLERFEFEELMREFPKIPIHACTVFSQRIRQLQKKLQSYSSPSSPSSTPSADTPAVNTPDSSAKAPD